MQIIYPDLAAAVRGVCQDWCQRHGYSDPFCRNGEWWAFPPNGVMLVRIRDAFRANDGQEQWVQGACPHPPSTTLTFLN
jgi:hypothetical protein